MGVRKLIRAGVLLAVAGGFCVALSLTASADVVEPKSAYQPASAAMLAEEQAAAKLAELAQTDPIKVAAATEVEKEKPSEVAVATPAPEQVVRPGRVAVMQSSSSVAVSLVDRIAHPLAVGLEHIEASLARVVSACDIGLGSGAGGPALVLAVLALASPFARRRVIGTRWATDEDVPEFLFAWEQTPPG